MKLTQRHEKPRRDDSGTAAEGSSRLGEAKGMEEYVEVGKLTGVKRQGMCTVARVLHATLQPRRIYLSETA